MRLGVKAALADGELIDGDVDIEDGVIARMGISLEVASNLIDADEFAVGDVTTDPEGEDFDQSWIVVDQAPNPGQSRDLGTEIDLVVVDPATGPVCP